MIQKNKIKNGYKIKNGLFIENFEYLEYLTKIYLSY